MSDTSAPRPAVGKGLTPYRHLGIVSAVDILSVSELTLRIRTLLEGVGRVAVEGEVTRVARPASGHVYFDLRDHSSTLNCKMWKSSVSQHARETIEEGARIVCHGKLDLWAPKGAYSLLVERVEARGLGVLLARLEELKRELREMGWFERRRPLPDLPRMIGVATSRDGAAFQDFLRTRSLRWPMYPLRLAHTAVQGAGAAAEIADAIARLDESGVDVIVVCRGGGSLEDLWCFNERAVAEAVHRASVPVVSGVGHEPDQTLCDLVADHRAHTPTDAAQTVVPDRRALERRLERAGAYLSEAVEGALARRLERLERAAGARVLRDASWILGERAAALAGLGRRMARAAGARGERAGSRLRELSAELRGRGPGARLERRRERLEAAARRLAPALRALAGERAGRLDALERGLRAISPFAVLRRGYSITSRVADGKPLRGVEALAPGERIESLLAGGRVLSTVERADPSAGVEAGEAR